jgi:hypothetical protein
MGSPHSKETREREWAVIVEQYSKRAFTRITDRLPALAGIATVHSASVARGSYLCGLCGVRSFQKRCFGKQPARRLPRALP